MVGLHSRRPLVTRRVQLIQKQMGLGLGQSHCRVLLLTPKTVQGTISCCSGLLHHCKSDSIGILQLVTGTTKPVDCLRSMDFRLM